MVRVGRLLGFVAWKVLERTGAWLFWTYGYFVGCRRSLEDGEGEKRQGGG